MIPAYTYNFRKTDGANGIILSVEDAVEFYSRDSLNPFCGASARTDTVRRLGADNKRRNCSSNLVIP
jgi:hypothetical protein